MNALANDKYCHVVEMQNVDAPEHIIAFWSKQRREKINKKQKCGVGK